MIKDAIDSHTLQWPGAIVLHDDSIDMNFVKTLMTTIRKDISASVEDIPPGGVGDLLDSLPITALGSKVLIIGTQKTVREAFLAVSILLNFIIPDLVIKCHHFNPYCLIFDETPFHLKPQWFLIRLSLVWHVQLTLKKLDDFMSEIRFVTYQRLREFVHIEKFR